MKKFIFFARVSTWLSLVLPLAAAAQDSLGTYPNYVVIGAFASHTNAIHFTDDANKNRFPAKFQMNPNRNLYYVYVITTDDREYAFAEALKLRTDTKYFDTWVYSGALGNLGSVSGSNQDFDPVTGRRLGAVGNSDFGQPSSQQRSSTSSARNPANAQQELNSGTTQGSARRPGTSSQLQASNLNGSALSSHPNNGQAGDRSQIPNTDQQSGALNTSKSGSTSVNGTTARNSTTGNDGSVANNEGTARDGSIAQNGSPSSNLADRRNSSGMNSELAANGLTGNNGSTTTNGLTTNNGLTANNGSTTNSGSTANNGSTTQNGLTTPNGSAQDDGSGLNDSSVPENGVVSRNGSTDNTESGVKTATTGAKGIDRDRRPLPGPPPVRATTEPLVEEDVVGKDFYFYLFRADNHNMVAGDVDAIDFEKSRRMATYEANVPVKVIMPSGKSKQISFVCQVFGYRKLQREFIPDGPEKDLYLDNKGNVVVPFELMRLQKGDIAIMYNVFFFKDAAIMRPESRFEVNNLLDLLLENPSYKIRIHGHTNGNAAGKIIRMGSPTNFYSLSDTKQGFGSAKQLSEDRAMVIRDFLISSGISADRMDVKAWGGKKPIHPKNSVRANENVRVEIEILSD